MKRCMSFFASAVLGVSMLATGVAMAQPPAPPAPASAPAPAEQHPHIKSAIHELEEAKHELETAAHDFGGHRVEAIEAVNNALKQLREALQYDKH